jgi:hypothetical protein
MTLITPEQPDPYGDGMQITAATRLDAVRHELALATDLRDVTAVESWLTDAHRTRMRLGQARPWINDAFALCAARRKELSATSAQSSPDGIRAVDLRTV